MNIKFSDMNVLEIDLYTELFIRVFNGEPWNDKWTKETAKKRIMELIKFI